MKNLSKICDAADWFDAEFQSIILNELKEPPRFHRKQWEFAMIFLALKKLGFLNEKMKGLSLGGGNERVLYSIAQHVKELIVTDLYDENTAWDCAKTTDPDQYIKESKPFEVDLSKIKALKMDMRYLDFEDNTFDFCYSSCAIEHIGDFDDFVRHLDEVYRVLKNDGVYVFTTEFKIGIDTIKDQNNFVFTSPYLKSIFNAIKLTPYIDADISLTNHEINEPLPSNVRNLCYNKQESFNDAIMKNYPHLILLRGKFPFTSIQFVMKKKNNMSARKELIFNGLSDTENYLLKGVQKYSDKIKNSVISFNPFSSLPGGVSPYFQDHADFFLNNGQDKNTDTLFHTDYFWLGEGERAFHIKFDISDIELAESENIIQLRIHSYPTLDSSNVECVFEKDLDLSVTQKVSELITLNLSEDYCYSVLGKMKSGKCTIRNLNLDSWNLRNKKSDDLIDHKVQQLGSVL